MGTALGACFLLAAEQAEAAVAEIELQLGARPKEQVAWPSAQELYQWGDSSGGSIRFLVHQELYRVEEDLTSWPVFQEPQIASA